jgi:hypothetical protein
MFPVPFRYKNLDRDPSDLVEMEVCRGVDGMRRLLIRAMATWVMVQLAFGCHGERGGGEMLTLQRSKACSPILVHTIHDSDLNNAFMGYFVISDCYVVGNIIYWLIY